VTSCDSAGHQITPPPTWAVIQTDLGIKLLGLIGVSQVSETLEFSSVEMRPFPIAVAQLMKRSKAPLKHRFSSVRSSSVGSCTLDKSTARYGNEIFYFSIRKLIHYSSLTFHFARGRFAGSSLNRFLKPDCALLIHCYNCEFGSGLRERKRSLGDDVQRR
jgi:hypothetical protein